MKKIISIVAALLLMTICTPCTIFADEEGQEGPIQETIVFPSFVTQDDGVRYYVTQEDYESQKPVVGLKRIEGKKYYFGKTGKLYKGGWKKIDNFKFYFSKKDGHAIKGWLKSKYYFNDNCHMIKGWKKINGKKYYFSKVTGKKLTGVNKIGKGKSAVVCTFSKYGVLTRKVYASKKSICLTFDDGPADSTKRVLGTLDKYKAKATFFMVGNRCKAYKKDCKRIVKRGHQVACHTYSHAWLESLSASGIRDEIGKGKRSVQKYTGVTPKICRTPGGQNTSLIRQNVGMPIILWSVDTLDWYHHDPAQTLSKVKAGARDGGIVLMHDLHATTADAVPSVCKYLKNQGYQMVTIKEMALLKGVKLKAGKVYCSF